MRNILLIGLFCILSTYAYAQSVKDLQQQQAVLQQELAETSKMLKQTKKNESATENKLNLLNNDIKTR